MSWTKLGILTSHPIQYQAPWFRALVKEMEIHVYFAHRTTPQEQAEAGFAVSFEWDVDLLNGYPHTFLSNCSKRPSVSHFFGCDTPEIADHIRMQKFDAFLVTGWQLKSYWQAVRTCRSLGVPVLVRGDSHLKTARSFLKRFVKRFCYRVLIQQFDGYLATGKESRGYFLYYGAKESRVIEAPHCVDNEWFRKRACMSKAQREAYRREFGIDDDSPLVIFVGKFVPRKRPLDLVRAISVLKTKGLSVHGLFVGSGNLEADIVREAKRLNVKIHLTGFKNQTELPRYYAMSDLLVLPSDGRETWGLVVNEAMACGLPAIVSDAVGCGPDLIESGKTGTIYPLGDVAKLSAAIEKMLPTLGSQEVKLALQEKMRKYSIASAVKGIRNAIAVLTSNQ